MSDEMKKNGNAIAPEVAENEFARFVECMDLDLDEAKMDSEDLTAFNKQKSKILRAIERGSLIINDDGEAVYTPNNKNTKDHNSITFHERSGASLMAMDNSKKGADVKKTYAILGDMCKVHPSTFAKMFGNDIKLCEAIFALLMD